MSMPFSWVESAQATNGLASATRAAPAGGMSHYITSVSGTFSATTTVQLMVLKQGSTIVARWHTRGGFELAFSSPIRIDPAVAVTLELPAGGSGVVGAVTLTGYTA
jgi:hypothetical protein